MKIHLIQSALDQKAETKLGGLAAGERCQGGSAMGRREEAGLPVSIGWRLGRVNGRASPHRAKSVSPPLTEIPGVAHAVSGFQIGWVHRVVISGTWRSNLTDEVPRRPPPYWGVSPGYKSEMKDWGNASVSRSVSHGSALRGCQQSQSSSGPLSERLNRNQSVNSSPSAGKVSRASAATKWPAGTSFRKHAPRLRNVPYGRDRAKRTSSIRYRETL